MNCSLRGQTLAAAHANGTTSITSEGRGPHEKVTVGIGRALLLQII